MLRWPCLSVLHGARLTYDPACSTSGPRAPPPRPFPVMSGYGGDGEAASLRCERGREHIGLIISYIVSALKRLRDTCVFYEKRETV